MSTSHCMCNFNPLRSLSCGLLVILVLLLSSSWLSAAEVQIAAGQFHTLVLTPDGRVWSFGDDSSGQLGDDTTQADKAAGVVVTGLTNVVAVAAGREHSLALRADGTVWSWGSNSAKQLGNITDSAASFKTTPQQISGLIYIVAIAAGGNHSLAVDRAGNVYAWGSNSEGQLGNGAIAAFQITASLVQAVGGGGSLTKAIAVAAGTAHSMALLADGTVAAWGRDDEGQIGNVGGTFSSVTVPNVVIGLSTATAIACGQHHSLARMANGSVRAWGKNDVGQLGILAPTNQATPVDPLISLVKSIAAGENHSLFLAADGSMRACGNDLQGALGNNGSLTNVTTPTGVNLSGLAVRVMGAGGNHSVVALADGSFRAWGADNQWQLGNGTTLTANQPLPSAVEVTWPMVAMTMVDAGQNHTVALQGSGSVWVWGNGSSGQLGNGSSGSSLVPVQVKDNAGTGTLQGIIAVSSGSDYGDHVLALAADGTVWAWGQNGNDQVGINGAVSTLLPVQVRNPGNTAALQNIIAIAAGDRHSLALAVGGTVYAWGFNSNGQLGNNSTTQSNLPVLVKVNILGTDLTNIKRLAAGNAHSLAINAAGDLLGWGSDAYGQMGTAATTSNKLFSYAIDTGEWIAIAAGGYHTRAIRHDSQLFGCGKNDFGQLGLGTLVDQDTLTTSGFSYSRGVAGGANHSLTWQAWGGTYAAGWNDYAQLGLGSKSTSVSNHTQINSLGLFPSQMDGGFLHSVVLKADGTVWCFGYNGNGQLGNGSTTEALDPITTTATWLPTITIVASDSSANEAGPDPGTFTITRTGTTAGAMTVRVALDVASTAASSDYSPTIPATITIPAGLASTPFIITPTDDFVNEPSETVVLRLQQMAGDPYVLGSAATQFATVTILDNDPIGLTVVQSSSPRLQTREQALVVNSTGVTNTVVNSVIAFAPGTDLSTVRVGMWIYISDGANSANAQVTSVNDGADTISTSMGSLTTTATAGTVYVGYYTYFSVRLTSKPSAAVTIPLQVENGNEGSLSSTSLTFTPLNWFSPQDVYVYPVDDPQDEGAGTLGDRDYRIYFVPPTAAQALDPAYVGVTHSPVLVTNVDDDDAGVVLSTTTLAVAEGGNKDGYSVRLASRPEKDVTITITSVLAQVTVDPVSLIFTSDDWDRPQEIKVTAVDDVFVEGTHPDTLTYTFDSVDPLYDVLVFANLTSIAITDNDVAGIEITPATTTLNPVVVTENDPVGTTVQVRLTASPQSGQSVRVDLTLNTWSGAVGDRPLFNVGMGASTTVSLTFLPGNWYVYQPVTITAPDEAAANNVAETFTIDVTTDDTATTDNSFDSAAATISGRTQDDDTAGIVVRNLTPSGAISADSSTDVTEGGATGDRIGVSLSVIPAAGEVVVVSIDGGTQISVSPTFLIFTAGNFSSEQIVSVTAVNDAIDEPQTSAVTIGFSTTTYASLTPVYPGTIAASLIANVTDDDTANIVVTPTAGLITTEAGGQATFSIVLTSQPANTVTIGLTVGGVDPDEALVSTNSVVFIPSLWNQVQTITVTGQPDSLDDGDRAYTIITAPATVGGTGDLNYAGRNASNIQGLNVDDDTVGVILNTTSIAVTEDATNSIFTDYTVRLASQPTAAVTVTINPGNQLLVDTDLSTPGVPGTPSTYQNTLLFEPTNTNGRIWSAVRTVRVTAIDDALAENTPETVLITHSASGGDYANVVIANISTSVTDNDTAGFLFNGLTTAPATLITTESGGSATYTMRLRSQPTAEVRITLGSDDSGAGYVDVDDLSPGIQTTLIFTPSDWDSLRTITVTGVDDDVVDGPQSYNITALTAVSADFKYNGLQALSVPCSTTDNDTASVAITPDTGLLTTEGGGQATFSVVLTSQPTDSVIVTFTSSTILQGTVDTDAAAVGNQSTITFTSSTWNVARTVTVTGADGDAVDNGVAGIDYQIRSELVVSDDLNYKNQNPIDVTVTNLAINNPPTLTAITNLVVLEDAGLQAVALSGIGVGQNGETQTLSFSVTSSDLVLIPTLGVTYSSGTTGTLNYTPALNETGTATITVTVTDTGGPGVLAAESLVRTFDVTVTPINDQPTLDAPPTPVALIEDAPLQNLTLTGLGSGAANETQTLTVTAVSSNPAVVPNPVFFNSGSNVVVLASGTSSTLLNYQPTAQSSGSAVITLTVQDDGGSAGLNEDTLVRTFTINVTAVNDQPTLVDPLDLPFVNEDAGTQVINLTGITSGAANETQTLVVTATSNNTGLIPNPILSYISPGTSGTLSFTPGADQAGQAIITVTVNDGGGGTQTIAQTFSITVNPVNDPPVATSSDPNIRKVPIATNRTITAADLFATDIDSALPYPAHDPGLVFTVSLAPGQGQLVRDLDLNDPPDLTDSADTQILVQGLTFTQQDLIDGRISYTHDGGSGASDGFAFTVSDSGIAAGSVSASPVLPAANLPPAFSGLQVFTITIDRRPPVIDLQPATTLAFTEDGAALAIGGSSTLADSDFNSTTGFNGGRLTVDFASGGTVNDVIAFDVTGPITIAGANVLYNGVVIGNFTNLSSVNGNVLEVNFTSALADLTSVASLIQRLTFRNNSQVASSAQTNPVTSRIARFVLRDNNGDTSSPATRTIDVTSVNDAPSSSTVTTLVTGVNVPIVGSLSVVDVDGDVLAFAAQGLSNLGTVTVNTVTGAYTFTPAANQSGAGTFIIRASDLLGAFTDITFTVTISPDAATRPWIVSDPPMFALQGDIVTYNIVAYSPGTTTPGFTVIGLASTAYVLSVTGTTATLTLPAMTLATPGPLNFGILVTDGLLTGFQPVTILVIAAPAGGG